MAVGPASFLRCPPSLTLCKPRRTLQNLSITVPAWASTRLSAQRTCRPRGRVRGCVSGHRGRRMWSRSSQAPTCSLLIATRSQREKPRPGVFRGHPAGGGQSWRPDPGVAAEPRPHARGPRSGPRVFRDFGDPPLQDPAGAQHTRWASNGVSRKFVLLGKPAGPWVLVKPKHVAREFSA